MPDEPLLAQFLEPEQAVEVAGVGVAPGMELEQVDPLAAQSRQRALDRRPHLVPGHAARLRDPLRRDLHQIPGRMPVEEDPGDVLGRAVVVGHVERRQALLDVGPHRLGSCLQMNRASIPLHISNLPEAGHHTGDRKPRRQLGPLDSDAHSSTQAAAC